MVIKQEFHSEWHDAKTDPPNEEGEYFVHMFRKGHKPENEYEYMTYYLDDWFYNDWEMTEMVVEWTGLPTCVWWAKILYPNGVKV